MSKFGTYWTTWYSMVSEQTFSCGNEMDKNFWLTRSTFEGIYSSRMWSQTILSWGKHSTKLQIRIVSRLWFCWRLWRLEVNIRRNSVHFRNLNVRAKKLDVQETNLSFTQFYRSWGDFSRCCFTHEWHSRSRSLGFGDWSLSFITKPNQQNQRCKRATGKRVCKHSTKRAKTNSNHAHQSQTNIDHLPSNGTHSGSNALLYVFEDTEAVIIMIIMGRSPMMRHVSRTVRVALDWLFDRRNWFKNSNSIRWHQTSTRRHFDQR